MEKSCCKPRYERRPPLILINGLAEQTESWYCNVDEWRKHFEIHAPNMIVYDGTAVQKRIRDGLPVDVDYFVEQLRTYIEGYVQRPPVYLLANSMGGKIAVEYTARFPDQVARLVLLGPAGLSSEERLPVIEGVRHNNPASFIHCIFHDESHADAEIIAYYQEKLASRVWRTGVMRTLRGTMEHRVADHLSMIPHPTLLIVGEEDRIVSPSEAIEAAKRLPRGRVVVLAECGHAPQIEKADVVNELVVDFLLEREGVDSEFVPARLPG